MNSRARSTLRWGSPMTEQKPLKLEVGKAYRTRDGRKVEILRKWRNHFGHHLTHYVGSDGLSYLRDGHWAVISGTGSDLIAEWDVPNADGWIQWSGGECPVPPDTVVDVRFRNGDSLESTVMAARCWRQSDYVSGGDIVAYRIVAPASATPKQEQPVDEKMTIECLFECFANWSDARQAGDKVGMKQAAAEAQRFLDRVGGDAEVAELKDRLAATERGERAADAEVERLRGLAKELAEALEDASSIIGGIDNSNSAGHWVRRQLGALTLYDALLTKAKAAGLV